MNYPVFLILTQIVCTLFMTGLIWFVQIVHYPLFERVGASDFASYEIDHRKLTTLVVAPAMLGEAFAAVCFIGLHPERISRNEAILGGVLVLIIWIATVLFSIPNHEVLSRGFVSSAHVSLCRLNWIRTAAWSARSVLLMYWLNKLLRVLLIR